MKKPAKMTEVDTNPKEPRSHTSSNCEEKYDMKVIFNYKDMPCGLIRGQTLKTQFSVGGTPQRVIWLIII